MKTFFDYNTPVSATWFNVVNGVRLRFDGDPANPEGLVDGQYLPIRLQDLDPAVFNNRPTTDSVVLLTGNQSIGGNKIFTSPVKIAPGVNDDEAVNRLQLNNAIIGLETNIGALGTAAVLLATDQTIGGVKTFSNPVVAAAAINGNQAIVKSQLDAATIALNDAILALNAATVKLTTAQTIAGEKTFTVSPQVPNPDSGNDAVNYATLLSAIASNTNVSTSNGCIKIGNIQIVFGSLLVFGYWQAIGTISTNINYIDVAPNMSTFNSIVGGSASVNRMAIFTSNFDNDNFQFEGDVPAGAYAQPNDGLIRFIVVGYI
jgi:hypothetical protein